MIHQNLSAGENTNLIGYYKLAKQQIHPMD